MNSTTTQFKVISKQPHRINNDKSTFFSAPRIQSSRLSSMIIYTRRKISPENYITRLHRNGEYFTSISFILRTWRRRFSRPTLEKWLKCFEMYLAAHDVKDLTRKKALLLYSTSFPGRDPGNEVATVEPRLTATPPPLYYGQLKIYPAIRPQTRRWIEYCKSLTQWLRMSRFSLFWRIFVCFRIFPEIGSGCL